MMKKYEKLGFKRWSITETRKTDEEIISFLKVCAEEDEDGTLLLHAIDRIATEKGMTLLDAMIKYGVRATLRL